MMVSQLSLVSAADQTTPSPSLLHILNLFALLKSPPPPSSPFVSISSSPLPYPARGERTVLIQGSGGGGEGGGALLSGPHPQWLFMPGPLGHQHDNVTMWQGFFKRDPVFVKCFPPLKSNRRAGSGDLESAHERRGPTLITQCERDGLLD